MLYKMPNILTFNQYGGFKKMEGLEGKIEAKNGDIIKLSAPGKELDICGYVVDLRTRSITLSHESPFSEITSFDAWSSGRRAFFTSGDRSYFLSDFESYKILESYKHTEKEE